MNIPFNGEMLVDRWNDFGAITPSATSTTFACDGWGVCVNESSKFTIQTVQDAPTGFKNSVKITVASQYSPNPADFFNFEHAEEGVNIRMLGLGTACAQPSSLAFGVKSSVTGTLNAGLVSGALDRCYNFSYTISTANQWSVIEVPNIPGVTSGGFPIDNTQGLYIRFDLGSGSNFENSLNTWLNANSLRTAGALQFVNQTVGSTIQFARIRYELGDTCTPWEYEDIGQVTRRASRYLPVWKFSSSGGSEFIAEGHATGSTTFSVVYKLTETPRITPTAMVLSSLSHFGVTNSAGSALSLTALNMVIPSQDTILINGSVASGLTQGDGLELLATTSAAKIMFTGPELR